MKFIPLQKSTIGKDARTLSNSKIVVSDTGHSHNDAVSIVLITGTSVNKCTLFLLFCTLASRSLTMQLPVKDVCNEDSVILLYMFSGGGISPPRLSTPSVRRRSAQERRDSQFLDSLELSKKNNRPN